MDFMEPKPFAGPFAALNALAFLLSASKFQIAIANIFFYSSPDLRCRILHLFAKAQSFFIGINKIKSINFGSYECFEFNF
jgi:hypothetical protein